MDSVQSIKPQFISVPFRASSANGMTEYNGIAKFSPAGIVIEFESVILGLIGGEVKEVQVSLQEILDIKFRKGIYRFFSQIQLRLRNFSTLSRLPNHDGKVKLKIKREDFEIAQKAVEQTLRYMSDEESAALYGDNEANVQLAPAPTSVNELFDTEKLESDDPKKTNKLDNFTR